MDQENDSKRLLLGARMVGVLPSVLRDVVLVYLAFAVVCIGLFTNAFEYGFYLPLVKEHTPWLLLGSVACGCLFALVLWMARRFIPHRMQQVLANRKRVAAFVGIGVVVLLVLQFLLANAMGFVAGSDSGILTSVSA